MKTDIKKVFISNIKFVEYSRSGVVYYTEDLEELYEFNSKGWNYNICNKGYRLIPPTATICDITECKKVEQYKNVILNIAYFDFLKDLIKKNKLNNYIDRIIEDKKIYYKNFLYHISVGPILETEVKIEGIDSRVETLKSDMISGFIALKEYKEKYQHYKEIIVKNKMFKRKSVTSEILCKYFKNIEKINLIVRKVEITKESYEIDKSVLDTINYDILLFIPYGCYKFIDCFIDENNYKKVMFWEFHVDDDKPTSHKIYAKEFKNKRVLLIDSVYSGKTLLKMKKIIEDFGGTPIVLGIAPKSLSVINILDYALILNKVYDVKKLNKEDNIFKEIYYDSIRRI